MIFEIFTIYKTVLIILKFGSIIKDFVNCFKCGHNCVDVGISIKRQTKDATITTPLDRG